MATTNGNGNGRVWQIGFWVLGFFCYVWLIGLTNGVIANDRIRSSEDKELRNKIDYVQDCINARLNNIDKQLSRIETKLEN